MRLASLLPRGGLLAFGLVLLSSGLRGDDAAPPAAPPPVEIAVLPSDQIRTTVTGFSDASDGDQRIERALRTIVSMKFRDVPLRLVAAELERVLQVPVRLDEAPVCEEPVDPAMLVSVETYATSLTEAISQIELTSPSKYAVGGVIRQGTLLIGIGTTDYRRTLLYDLRSLQAVGLERLSKLIQAHTSGPWEEDEPGTGNITIVGSALLIRTDQENHRQIERFLALLRQQLEALTAAGK